jgi:O-acetylserine/cysteine efflux transporter
MTTNHRRAIAALAAAGLLWGTTVPLSKLALEWLPPGWLAFARFGLAAAVLLAAARRRGVRAACTPLLLASGAFGYGGSVVVQNAGITRTSVTHAALLIGAVPVMVAIIAALWQHTVARPVAWAGFALSLAGVGLVAGGQGGGATLGGDGLVLASLLMSATFTVAQGRLLPGRDPVAVTAVQFLGAALAVLPFSAIVEGVPAAPHDPGAVLAVLALAAGGTLLPFTLFAYGQSRVSAEVAGAFLNLEPLVGAVAGIVLFGDPAGPAQAAGGAAIVAGIALSSLPLLGSRAGGTVVGATAGSRAGGDAARSRAGGHTVGSRVGDAAIQARMRPKPASPGSWPPRSSYPRPAGTRARSQSAGARGARVSRGSRRSRTWSRCSPTRPGRRRIPPSPDRCTHRSAARPGCAGVWPRSASTPDPARNGARARLRRHRPAVRRRGPRDHRLPAGPRASDDR